MLQIRGTTVYYHLMIKQKYKAVIFDLDGTLVDSMKDIAAAINRVLKDYDLPVQDTDYYRSRVGWGLKKSLELTLPPDKWSELDDALELLLKFYRENPCAETEVYEGIYDVLKDLKTRAVDLFVYTNKDQRTAEKIIDNVFPESTFSAVFGALPGKALKPDSLAVKSVIAQTGFSNDEILYIGDSEIDMETAAAGGMDSIACLWGYRKKEELDKYKKLAYMQHPQDLRHWIVYT